MKDPIYSHFDPLFIGSEKISQPLYDTVQYSRNMCFFQEPINYIKDINKTNMFLPASLPEKQFFVINGVSILALTNDRRDYINIMRNGVLSLNIGSKNYLTIAPLRKLRPIFNLDSPLLVSSNVYFSVNIDSDYSGIISTKIVCYLHGDLYRPFQ